MPKIILKNHVIIGKEVKQPGEEVDIDKKLADDLVEKGFAIKANSPEAKNIQADPSRVIEADKEDKKK